MLQLVNQILDFRKIQNGKMRLHVSLFKMCIRDSRTTGQFVGGAQWHPFDHQRGYHPDPYFGGIYDAVSYTHLDVYKRQGST